MKYACFFATCLAIHAATVSDLARDADTIVAGTITTRSESSTLVSFDITIERIFKGDTSLRTVHVHHPWIRKGIVLGRESNTVEATFRGIWFLRRIDSTPNNWDVLPANGIDGILANLFYPAAKTLQPQYPAVPASLLDTLMSEIISGVRESGNPELLLYITRSSDSEAVRSAFWELVRSPSVRQNAIGVAGLLSHQDPQSISELRRLWPSIKESNNRSFVLNALAQNFRVDTPPAVRQLVQFAIENAQSEIRSAAVRALAAIHSKEALPFLASLLDSSDSDEAMKGVWGLSSFANGCPKQTPQNVVSMQYLQFLNPSPYRNEGTIKAFAFRRGPEEQEKQLISFWMKWWESNRASLETN